MSDPPRLSATHGGLTAAMLDSARAAVAVAQSKVLQAEAQVHLIALGALRRRRAQHRDEQQVERALRRVHLHDRGLRLVAVLV